VVERIFGVFKRRFKIFVAAPEYPLDLQAMFVPALSGIHNFISIYDPSDESLLHPDLESIGNQSSHSNSEEPPRRSADITEMELGLAITAEERHRSIERRDRIAKQMWEDYKRELERRSQYEGV
jgi:hypothetical protein